MPSPLECSGRCIYLAYTTIRLYGNIAVTITKPVHTHRFTHGKTKPVHTRFCKMKWPLHSRDMSHCAIVCRYLVNAVSYIGLCRMFTIIVYTTSFLYIWGKFFSSVICFIISLPVLLIDFVTIPS